MRATVTFEGNLADDPQVRLTPSGKPITEITVLVNARRQNSDGEWVEVGPGAVLLSTLTPAATNDQAPQLVLARLRLDGADSVMFARVNIEAQSQNLQPGTRLVAQFEPADEKGGRDFWFEPRRGL